MNMIDNLDNCMLEGEGLIACKKYMDAEKIFAAIIKAFPNNAKALYNKGLVCVALNQMHEAKIYFEQAICNGYENYQCLTSLALVEKALQNEKATIDLLQKAAKKEENNPIPHILLLSEFMEQDKYEEAWMLLEAKKKILAQESLDYLKIRAQIASKLQMKEEALSAFCEIYKKYKKSSAALSAAVVLFMDGHAKEADNYLKEIIKSGKKTLEYCFALCLHIKCMEMSNQEQTVIDQAYIDAAKEYEEMYQKSEYNAYVMQFVVECYNALGDKENETRCRKIIQEFRDIFTNDDEKGSR